MNVHQAAFECNGQTVSTEYFYRVACNPNRHVVVEACAGAGKTWMLVSRILIALLHDAKPRQILAITFTKKAAGEMQARLYEWMAQFSMLDDSALDQELLLRGVETASLPIMREKLRTLNSIVLNDSSTVQIKTFHSWFVALVQCAPIEIMRSLGFPTTFTLEQNDEAIRKRTKFWRRFRKLLLNNPSLKEDYSELLHQLGSHNLQLALSKILDRRCEFELADKHGILITSVTPHCELFPELGHLNSFEDMLWQASTVQRLWQTASLLGKGKKRDTDAATALSTALESSSTQGVWDALFTKTTGTPKKFSKDLDGLTYINETTDLLLHFKRAEHQARCYDYQQRMTRLARALIAEYAACKREIRILDMTDIEVAAMHILSDTYLSSWILERLDAQIRYLLIDEFQDTSPLQWHTLYAWLSNYAGASSGPRLFIVGDPKQSIYRFRRADPEVFNAAKAFVCGELGGSLLSCDHTRRCSPTVCDVVNALFLSLQEKEDFNGFRQHSTASNHAGQLHKLPLLLATPKNKSDSKNIPLVWRDTFTTRRREEEESRKMQECQQAALFIADQLQQGVSIQKPSDIMVLARKGHTLQMMGEALNQLGLNAQLVDKSKLTDHWVVQDIISLLTAFAYPTQNLALARALKSPIFSFSDSTLSHIASQVKLHHDTQAQAISWFEWLTTSPDLDKTPLYAKHQLIKWQTLFATHGVVDALAILYVDADIEAKFVTAAPKEQRSLVSGILMSFLQIVFSIDGGRFMTLWSLLEYLQHDETELPLLTKENAIQLLTIHKAKGLEARCVVLLDTHPNNKNSASYSMLIDWPSQQILPQRFIFIEKEKDPPLCAKQLLQTELAARRREELNALYVSLTRAESSIVLSGNSPKTKTDFSWWDLLDPYFPSEVTINASSNTNVDSSTKPETIILESIPSLIKNDISIEEQLRQDNSLWWENDRQTKVFTQELDSPASRLGQAMHQLLEWYQWPANNTHGDENWTETQIRYLKKQYDLTQSDIDDAIRMASNIVTGEAAWMWDPAHIAWAANEVRLLDNGQELRIDRLLLHTGTQEMWVLDYKSHHQPEHEPALIAQLSRYRQRIQAIYPQHKVQAAFLTSNGKIIPQH